MPASPQDIKNLNRVKELCYEMLEVADNGDRYRSDDGSGVVFGLLRDSAYKIRSATEKQLKRSVSK
jgi:hypothetical protein